MQHFLRTTTRQPLRGVQRLRLASRPFSRRAEFFKQQHGQPASAQETFKPKVSINYIKDPVATTTPPPSSKQVFEEQAQAFIANVESTMGELLPQNPGMQVDKCSSNELVINGPDFHLKLTVDLDQLVLSYFSSASGNNYLYNWDDEHKRWLGIQDKHDLEGMLVRDFIKVGHGLLQL